MKFELTKSEEDIPFIECDIDSFVEYQFQDFFLSEPRRLKPIVEKVQELINTFIAEIENRNERQVKKLISNYSLSLCLKKGDSSEILKSDPG